MPFPEPIISVSGLRGIVGESLTPETVVRYLGAFHETLPPGPVVVTRDGRTTGPMLADAVRATLAACGRTVLDGGPAATPTTGVLVRQHEAAGGVQISASHNPPEYNGLKLFNRAGRVIPASAGQLVLDAYATTPGPERYQSYESIGRTVSIDDPTGRHLELLAAICDVERIRSRAFRVLLDANHGAGAVAGRPLLESLGCEIVILGEAPTGHFLHVAEPTAENLAPVLSNFAEHQVDIGFCQDPDADRLAIIDEKGRYVGEEYTLAVCVDHTLRRRPGPIVTNCSTSRMSEDLAQQYGVPFFRSKVGEANVVDQMLAENAVLGGEGNGGVIDPRVVLVRDSLAAMALVLDAMASRECPPSQLVDELPRYAICKTKIPLGSAGADAVLDRLPAKMPDAQVDRLDGLRLDWSDRWLLVRASNTEPIIRAIAEAPTYEQAKQLCEAAAR